LCLVTTRTFTILEEDYFWREQGTIQAILKALLEKICMLTISTTKFDPRNAE
jgi:hypothetical protein